MKRFNAPVLPSVHVVLVALLFVVVALAGCHDLGGTTREHPADRNDALDEGPESTDEPSPEPPAEEDRPDYDSAGPSRLDLDLELGSVSPPVYTGEARQWSVVVSGEEAVVDWWGVRWSLESTAQLGADELETGVFEGGQAADGDDASVPGVYSVSWTPPDARTYYLRAHVEADGFHYWSDEVSLDVTPAVEEVEHEATQSVRMRTDLLDPCDGDSYSKDPLEIEPGAVVEWTNAATCPHTATHNATDPLWSTGQLEPNDTSSSFRFNKPGVYEVRCDNHPGMTHEIVVG